MDNYHFCISRPKNFHTCQKGRKIVKCRDVMELFKFAFVECGFEIIIPCGCKCGCKVTKNVILNSFFSRFRPTRHTCTQKTTLLRLSHAKCSHRNDETATVVYQWSVVSMVVNICINSTEVGWTFAKFKTEANADLKLDGYRIYWTRTNFEMLENAT